MLGKFLNDLKDQFRIIGNFFLCDAERGESLVYPFDLLLFLISEDFRGDNI